MMSDKRTWQVCLRAPTVSFMMGLARQCACFILGLGPVPTDGGFDEPVGRRTGKSCSKGGPQERLFIRHRLQRFPAGVIRADPNISPPLIKSGCQTLARSSFGKMPQAEMPCSPSVTWTLPGPARSSTNPDGADRSWLIPFEVLVPSLQGFILGLEGAEEA